MRVLYSTDSYCPCCGHNRDTSSVSTINLEDGRYQCQMCQTVWREASSMGQEASHAVTESTNAHDGTADNPSPAPVEPSHSGEATPEYEPHIVGGRVVGYTMKNCPPVSSGEATPRPQRSLQENVIEAVSEANKVPALESENAELRRELEEAVEFTIRAQDAEIAERKKAESAEADARELWEILSYFVSNHHGPRCKCNWCATFEKHRAKYGRKG